MTYFQLYYHLIWCTSEREPLLTVEREKVFYGVLYQKAKEMDTPIYAAGNVEDHVHIVLSIPPKIAIADCVRHYKGASAFAINHMPGSDGGFKWQEGYGVLSFGRRSLDTVMAYASRQKEHHREATTMAGFERMEEDKG